MNEMNQSVFKSFSCTFCVQVTAFLNEKKQEGVQGWIKVSVRGRERRERETFSHRVESSCQHLIQDLEMGCNESNAMFGLSTSCILRLKKESRDSKVTFTYLHLLDRLNCKSEGKF